MDRAAMKCRCGTVIALVWREERWICQGCMGKQIDALQLEVARLQRQIDETPADAKTPAQTASLRMETI